MTDLMQQDTIAQLDDGVLFIDLETRSTRSVVEVGAHELAHDPDLRLLCASYALNDEPVDTWRCAFHGGDPDAHEPIHDRLMAMLLNPNIMLAAWNAQFERLVLNARSVARRYGLPPMPLTRFICVMAMARSHNLPGSLHGCTTQWLPSDKAKIAATGKQSAWMWSTDTPLLPEAEPLFEDTQVVYCERDVDSMRDMWKLMLPPTDDMLNVYWANERINDRGLLVDTELAQAAITLQPRVDKELRKELAGMTEEDVKPRGPSLKNFLLETLPPDLTDLMTVRRKERLRGDEVGFRTVTKTATDKSVRAALTDALMNRDDIGAGERGLTATDFITLLRLYSEANQAAASKYAAALARMDADEGCLRGAFMFAGAAQTGRFSSTGFQMHNMVRMVPKNATEIRETLIDHQNDPDSIVDLIDMSVNECLGKIIRTAILAEDGRKLGWVDLSGIEARMNPWLADDANAERLLDIFREGGDVYIDEASGILNKPYDQVTEDERQAYGKVPVLALGFGGAAGAFAAMAKNYGVTLPDAEVKRIVKAWRRKNKWAKRFWNALQSGAINAIRDPQRVYKAGRIDIIFVPDLLRGTLLLFLPSGRPLVYPDARIMQVEKFGDRVDTIVFQHPTYGLSDTYGGKLCENCLAAATDVLTTRGWVPIVDVTLRDKLWDGVEWVTHDGLIAQGVQPTMTFNGVGMTPEHKVLTDEGWKPAETCPRPAWADLWMPDGSELRRHRGVAQRSDMALPLHLRGDSDPQGGRAGQDGERRLQPILRHLQAASDGGKPANAWDVNAPGFHGVVQYAGAVSGHPSTGLEELRRAGHHGLRTLGHVRKVLAGYGADLARWVRTGPARQFEGLQPRELPLGGEATERQQQAHDAPSEHGATGEENRHPKAHAIHSLVSRPVYDIRNAGPRTRFMVMGDDGPFIVSNCTQAAAADILREALVKLDDIVIGHVHDEVIFEADADQIVDVGRRVYDVMTTNPIWADGLPLDADGDWGDRYKIKEGAYPHKVWKAENAMRKVAAE